MAFEKTKKAADGHTEEDVADDLKDEEVTSTDTGQSDDTDSEEDTSTNDTANDDDADEESGEGVDWEARALKAEEDRDNYKRGMLSAKGRTIDTPKLHQKPTKVDVTEEAVVSVLEKQNERKVLKDVVDSRSKDYIPELVDENQYNQIIGYLPRNLDKSNQESIVRALRFAVRAWKDDKGIKDKPPKQKGTELSHTKGEGGSGAPGNEKTSGRKILKSSTGMKDWYK
mgnify:CR=1 FL=1